MSETKTCEYCGDTIKRGNQSAGTWSRMKFCPAPECRRECRRQSERRAYARRKAGVASKPLPPRIPRPLTAEELQKAEANRRGLEAWLERARKSAQLQRQKDQMRKRGAYI